MFKIILAIIAVVFIFAAVGYLASRQLINKKPQQTLQIQTPTPTSQPLKTFKSNSVMKFSIRIPEDFSIEEKFTRVKLNKNEEDIYIEKVGTNFSNVEDYLADLHKSNKTQILSQETKKIGSYIAILETIKSPNKNAIEKVYSIYVDNFIYTFSTSSESLYDDLDQIAQSFRYIP